ncbi:MAG: acyltransferase [Sporocytophaga sp.]|nr:acyltransferase [Sporocytophaga sp.]
MQPSSTNTSDASRVYGLDILRAIAIIFVLEEHGNDFLYEAFSIKAPHLDGVKLFFVLSGFLIGQILIKTLHTGLSMKDLYAFWIRRWFRTLPNYYLILILLVGLNILLPVFKGSYTSFFFFCQNLIYPQQRFFLESWSLAVEEWFYILFPVTLYLSNKAFPSRHKISLLTSIGIFIIGAVLVRIYKESYLDIQMFKDWDVEFRKVVFTRLDNIVFGVLGAFFSTYYHSLWVKHKLPLLISGILLLLGDRIYFLFITNHIISFGWYSNIISFTLGSVATLALLPFLSEIKTGKGILYRFLTYVSITSYSIYMVNLSLVRFRVIPYSNEWLLKFGLDSYISYIDVVLYWVYTIVLSLLLYHFFEKPMTSLRDKWYIKKSQPSI